MRVRILKPGLLIWLIFQVCEVKCKNKLDPCRDTYYWVPKMDGELIPKSIPISNVTKICSNFMCITKCCPPSQVHFTSSLQPTQGCRKLSYVKNYTNHAVDILTKFDYSELSLYKLDADNDLKKSKLTLKHVKVRFNGKFFRRISDCTSGIYPPGTEDDQKYFLLEGGTLVTEKPNYYVRYPEWSKDNFCFEYLVDQYMNKTDNLTKLSVKMHFLTYPKPESVEVNAGDKAYSNFKIVAFIISSFFILLVLVVYGSLPELRGIGGMVQMAYCATYMAALILNAALILGDQELIDAGSCRYITVVNYFLLFSSFFWLNIMSFDIWWSFRGWYKQRKIHRRGELVKFGWYALYAWGTPFVITTVVSIIDFSDMKKYPYILKPFFENCFQNTTEIKFYYNIPIGILLGANIIFFALTAYSYWRIKKDLAKFQDSDTSNRSLRLKMYLKLAVIMGIGWIFDVLMLPECLEIISSVYNGLIGVAIFFVFVFKRKILVKFCQRYGLQQRFKFVENLERRWSTSTKSQKRSVVESEDSGIQLELRPIETMTTATELGI